ncbi:MAG: BatA domain-containing protein [Bacteroidia bacterium]|nr:BatA domain-containing protein [Bacteroidia bacterium]MCX7763423.1 BatA domain-containing protein [Bacteroidia bacterium]MDW8057588.1 BatA domain-containing protein [Bacteroidia bacterium]
MNFLLPNFLWGLLALGVPIIVHFFYLRRAKRYEFSQAALVEKLRQASRPYLRLRHWILLALRLAIVTAIVFLFARPKIGQALPLPRENASVLIVWDVSPSMTAVFSEAQALLIEALRRDPPTYEYRLLTTDSYLPKGGFVSARLLIEKLREVRPASMGYPIAAILERGEMFFTDAQYSTHKVYIVSDFQRSSVGEFERLSSLPISEMVLIPVANPLGGNAYIDSLWAVREGSGWLFRFHLQGEAGRLYTVQIGERKRSLLPGTYEEILPASLRQVRLTIEGDALPFDNEVTAGLQDPQKGRIGWNAPLGEPFVRLHRLLGIEPKVPRSSADWQILSVFVGEIGRLPEEISSWVAEGGSLVAFPPATLSPALWQKFFLSAEVPPPQQKEVTAPFAVRPVSEPFWEGIFLPTGAAAGFLAEPLVAFTLYQFQVSAGRALLANEQGEVLLWEIPFGRGRVYLFTFPWEKSTLGNHSLFVPLMARLYNWGEAKGSVWAAEAGKRFTFSADMPERPRLRHLSSGSEYMPATRRSGASWLFSFGEQPLPLGLYEIRGETETYGFVGLNVAVEESSSPPLPLHTLSSTKFPIRILSWEEGRLSEKSVGISWRDWHIWLVAALLLIGIETFWARQLLRPKALTVPSP